MAFDPSTAILADEKDKEFAFDPTTAVLDNESKPWAIVQSAKDWYSGAQKNVASVNRSKNLPGYLLRIAGGAVGSGFDIPGKIVSTAYESAPGIIKAPLKSAGDMIKNSPIGTTFSDIMGKYNNWKSGQSQETQDNLSAGENLLTLFPGLKALKAVPKVIKVGTGISGNLIKGAGAIEEKAGTALLQKELSPKASIIKKGYGADMTEKFENTMQDIKDFGLHTKGSFKGMKKSAKNMANERLDKADKLLNAISSNPDMPLTNPVLTVQKWAEENASKITNVGEYKDFENVINEIITDMTKDGLYKQLPLNKLVDAKKSLNRRGDLFEKGLDTGVDAIKKDVRKRLYYEFIDKISEISPDLQALNTDAKKLLDIQQISDDAVLREAKSKLTNIDKVTGTVGAASLTAMHHGTLSPDAIMAAIAAYGIKKAASSGRIAGGMISMGRGIQKFGNFISPGEVRSMQEAGILRRRDSSSPTRGEVFSREDHKAATTPYGSHGKRNISVSDFEKEFKSNLSGSEQKMILRDIENKGGEESSGSRAGSIGGMEATKIVDKVGKPMPMYHGTLDDFDVFDESLRGTNTNAKGAEGAFFFAKNRADADLFKTKAEEKYYSQTGEEKKGVIKKVYLNSKNPLILDDEKRSNVNKNILDKLIDDDAAAIDYAKGNGYDSVVWPHGNINNSDHTVAVFSPTQISMQEAGILRRRDSSSPTRGEVFSREDHKKSAIKRRLSK